MDIIRIIFIFIGFIIRIYSINKLGKDNFSINIKYPEKLITDGIYKYIRNPCYLGTMLIMIGLCYGSLTGLGLIWLTFMFLSDRADLEEIFLYNKFGQDFINYKNKTKFIIPFIF